MMRSLPVWFLVAVVLCSGLASGFGVVPARQRVDFSEEQVQVSVTLENPDRLEGRFKVRFSGELASYAHYTTKYVYLDAQTTSDSVPFTLKLPPDVAPGTRKLSVEFEQVPDEQGGTVGGLIVLAASVVVDVPVSGQYVSALLSVGEAGPAVPTPITVSLLNKGESEVAVWADLVVRGPTNEELASWQTERVVVPYQGSGKIATQWVGAKQPGLYALEVTVHYGDELVVLRDSFVVGSREVVAEGLSADRFSLGSIVPVEVSVRSRWNDILDDVFAEVFVLGADGVIVQSFKTASGVVAPVSRAVLLGYWDTDKLVVGSYDLNVVVHFPGGESQRSFPVVVKMDELEVDNRLTGEVVAGGEGSFGQNSLLALLILVLIVTNVVIIYYFRRMRRK